jgi:hypothetical protein
MPRQTKCGYKPKRFREDEISNISRIVANGFKTHLKKRGIQDEPTKSVWFSRNKQKAANAKKPSNPTSKSKSSLA